MLTNRDKSTYSLGVVNGATQKRRREDESEKNNKYARTEGGFCH